jgi:pimeloyl-ACP methyl ester carboxylesterase
LDFWGFGESGKKRSTYDVEDFVDLVDQFMDQLGISSAPVVGHSMGGTVGLSFAINYPQRVSKVVVIGAPINGSSLDIILKLAGYRPIAFVVHNAPGVLKLGIRLAAPLITQEKKWPEMIGRDLSKTTLESFLMSIASLRKTDLRPQLGEITVPTMGIYGRKDALVDPRQWQPLAAGVSDVRIERFQNSGHFPMLDQPLVFMHTLKDFLDHGAGK